MALFPVLKPFLFLFDSGFLQIKETPVSCAAGFGIDSLENKNGLQIKRSKTDMNWDFSKSDLHVSDVYVCVFNVKV